MLDQMATLLVSLRRLPMPIIVAWEGAAVGAGAGIALAGDLRVVARSAVLITGHARIGMTPDGGLSALLTRAVGGARAMSLMLRGATLDAQALDSYGLADEIVEDGSAIDTAVAMARSLGQSSAPLAVLGLRDLVDRAARSSLADQLETETWWATRVFETSDFHEGIGAFFDRRNPAFTGK
jgi:2-(1,2-epoxy-1,2-dihydrophenyl)acetyl-CoA isomerase